MIDPVHRRSLAASLLLAIAVTIGATGLPDRPGAAKALEPLSTDSTHLREDLAFAVQIELATRGFDPGPIDGIPSVRTADAIRGFLAWAGLPGPGVADLRLVIALYAGP